MSFDTQQQNKQRINLSSFAEIWLFGYGSLIHKVDFPIIDKRDAYINDWQRRFWQGSHDHRGTPDKPGRVLTLVESEGAICHGVAYRVSAEVFDFLDHREKNCYLRHEVTIHFSATESKTGLIYIADKDNEAYLGPASEREIAQHIAISKGPSGPNPDYVIDLANALRSKGVTDNHVFAVEQELANIGSDL